MTLRTSFRSKLLMLTIAPLAAAQVVTLFAVMRTVEQDVDMRARDSLSIGGKVVSEFLSAQGRQLRTSVEVLSDRLIWPALRDLIPQGSYVKS